MTEARSLTANEIEQFHALGYVSGLDLVSPEAMATICARVRAEVSSAPSQDPRVADLAPDQRLDRCRHIDSRLIYDLCMHPAIVEPIKQLFGPDLVLWKTQIFDRPAYGPALPHHQGRRRWELIPCDMVSAWIALDDATLESGCLEVLPGTQDAELPIVAIDQASAGQQRIDWATELDDEQRRQLVPLPLRAGQFLLFHDLVHGTSANHLDRSCLALVARYSPAHVHMDRMGPPRTHLLVSGHVERDINLLGEPPPPGGGLTPS